MALITCSECGGQMSDRAKECPHCGSPIEICKKVKAEMQTSPNPKSQKRGSKFIVGGIVVAIVLAVATFLLVKNESVFASKTLKITPEFTKALERYDRIDAFSEGLAAVHRDGKWGYINLKGEEVIPCQFSDDYRVGQFSEGVACVVDTSNKSDSTLWNSRVGFINKKGELVLEGDFFTEAHCPYAFMAEYTDYLPSFKDGKVAVWDMPSTYADWDEWSEKCKIVLVDHKGNTYEVSDSIGKELSTYQPYPKISTAKPKRIEAYNDYYINEYRDTFQCDNGARFVSWCIIDENDLPYNTKDKSVGYYIDNYGNSTLTYAEKEAMEQHLNGVVAHLADQHNERLLEEHRRQWEEEQRQRQREWLYGTWEYNGTIDMGVYLGGVKRVTSKLVITEDNITVYDNGSLEYNGSYEIEGDRIVYDKYNGSAIVLPFDKDSRKISLGQGKYYSKTSSATSNYSSNYNSYSYSTSSTTFRTVADVWAYLSDHTFTGNGTSFRISERYISINGTPATGGVRVSNIRATSATLSASSPYLGGQQIILYLNAANGTIISDGLTYYAH